MTLDNLSTMPATLLLPPGLHRAEDFGQFDTLGDVLFRLGHDCRGRCPGDPYSLVGLICVIPRRRFQASVSLIVIDLTYRPEPLIEMFRVLRAMNSCARLERIRVVPSCSGPY